MRIFVDENIPRMTANQLRDFGHDVIDIRRTNQEGISDDEIWQIVQREKRLLITTDKGFLEHRNSYHSGILVITLRQPNRCKIHEKVIQVISQFQSDEWSNTIVVIKDRIQSVWKLKELNED